MSDYILFTDSTCDLNEELYTTAGLRVLVMQFTIDGKDYPDDGKTLAGHDFYQAMRDGAMPTTAQMSMQAYRDAFEPELAAGRDVLYLCFSSALSGQYQTASIVGAELAGEYPGRKLYVIDSTCQCGGEGRLALAMAAKKREGLDIDALRDWLERNKQYFIHYFTLDDLGHLYRGGRLSRASAVAGSLLGIKPVMYTAFDGRLTVGSKVRGRKASLKMLCDRMLENAIEPEKQDMFIQQADCPKDAEWMKAYILERAPVKSITILPMGPVIGSHVGPTCIALFFTGRTRVWHV